MNLSFLTPWLKSKPVSVTVRTYKTKKTDLERVKDAKTRQLAAELGKPWPTSLRASIGRGG